MTDPLPHSRTKAVLVVDDEPSILEVMQMVLTNAGFEVSCGSNGIEGLRLFHEREWDAVVTDRSMPEMDGEEMATQMRELRPDVPIILLTGTPGRTFKPGLFDAIFAKPFGLTEIQENISRIIDERRHHPVAQTS